ncbi:FCD domain-containing protein [Cupriavidus sp. 2SB]|uniref:GntR family transcriptional regulator n=1 Tax=Cupriavidus sp. 2SB TaxID=2502199 RepID=UPI0010F67CCE|nr:FCD domain-containing protein [Cupriavidus sp. 2SB]
MSTTSLSPKSQTLAVFESIRGEILDARVEPGSRLHVASLVDRYGVSQSAVREALSRLVADGLAIALDQKGFRVAPVSIADLHDLTESRIEMECVSLRRSIERGDAAWEARVLAAYHELSRSTPVAVAELQGTMLPWAVLHRRFHNALVSAAGSDWLERFREIMFDQSERYRMLSVSHPVGPRDVNAEHRALMDAALERNVDKVNELVAAHFRETANVVTAAMEQRAKDAE